MPTWTNLDKTEKDAWTEEAARKNPSVTDRAKLERLAKALYTENFG